MKKKVLIVFGTRPEAIKMAPVYHALKSRNDKFETLVCVSAQHRQMLDQVLSIFSIDPDFDLDLMKSGQDLFDVTSKTLEGMKNILSQVKPNIVMVHGDTTTTLAASIASFYMNIPVWHVEAGLRTFNMRAPYPEEFNRQVVSRISDMHLAPTELAKKNLLDEKVKDNKILVTGNTVIDGLFFILDKIESEPELKNNISDQLKNHLSFDWEIEKFILITGHRRENFGDSFKEICLALKELAIKNKDLNFVYPVHLNPNVQKPVNEVLGNVDNIFLIPPLQYDVFVYLLKHSYLVITDSGGIQEEAPSLGKPVLVLREITERPEAIEAGTVILVGANKNKIIKNVTKMINDTNAYQKMSIAHNPYGDGNSSPRILDAILNFLR